MPCFPDVLRDTASATGKSDWRSPRTSAPVALPKHFPRSFLRRSFAWLRRSNAVVTYQKCPLIPRGHLSCAHDHHHLSTLTSSRRFKIDAYTNAVVRIAIPSL